MPLLELVGQAVDTLLPDALRGPRRSPRCVRAGAARRPMGSGLDLAARRKNGTEFPVEISLSPMVTPEGHVIIAAVRNITERKRIEADLRLLNEDLARKRRGGRAGGAGARGTARAEAGRARHAGRARPRAQQPHRDHVLADRGDADGRRWLSEHVRHDLEVLHRQTHRVARITQGLLTFACSSAGERTPVDFNHVVRETLLLAENQIAKGGVKVATDLAPDLPAVLGDADTLQQVMLNLVTNARDAVESGGEIRIVTRLRESDRMIELVVADTGRGIAPEDVTRIFDPFFTTKPTGTGLGLSLTHGIVREHGGTIDVESAPGAGTRFILALPGIVSGMA